MSLANIKGLEKQLFEDSLVNSIERSIKLDINNNTDNNINIFYHIVPFKGSLILQGHYEGKYQSIGTLNNKGIANLRFINEENINEYVKLGVLPIGYNSQK